MSRTKLRVLLLSVFAVTCLGAAGYLLARVGTNLLPTDGERYHVEADVRDAIALANAADVRQAGVKIGQVSALKEKGRITALKLDLERDKGPIYRDATVLVRAKSIAEENYVDLDPGTPGAGAIPEGGVLPVSREQEATQNDDVFSILDAPRRRNLQRAVKGIGGGLDGSGARDLNATLESSTALVDDGSDLTRVLAEQRNHVAGLVDSLGTVARALGERKEAIRTLTLASKAEAEAVAARDDDLRATLRALPPFLRQGQRTATKLTGFSGRAVPVMRDLRLAADDLVPAVNDLRPAAADARVTLRRLRTFSVAARPAFQRLRPFAQATEGFVPPYEAFLRQVAPFSRYMEPYSRELSTWFALDAANTDAVDSVGHVARVLLPVSRSSFPATLPKEVEDLLKKASSGLDTRGANPLPAPGTAAAGTPRTGPVPQVDEDAPYGR